MAMKSGLQELSFGSWFDHAAHSVEHDVSTAVHDVTPLAKEVAGEAWKGATECAANAHCRALVSKYGQQAVKMAMSSKLQEMYPSQQVVIMMI